MIETGTGGDSQGDRREGMELGSDRVGVRAVESRIGSDSNSFGLGAGVAAKVMGTGLRDSLVKEGAVVVMQG